MVTLLAKWFIPDRENIKSPGVRQAYGMLCGAVGIGFNIILFMIKFFAGMISGSIAITADAFNNLSDAGSSIVTLVGFKMAGQEADSDHPFGHGRIEYITGFIVSVVIVVMGLELGKSSVDKIIHPEDIVFQPIMVAILVISVLVKIYMNYYNRKIADQLNSASIRATATDSLSDSIATTFVLVGILISVTTGLQLDGYFGLLVALFILKAGIGAAIETLNPLLGQPPEKEYVESIEEYVMSHPDIVGVHDLVVHDYGPGRRMISLHTEVPASGDILELHDTIDNIERELREKMGCEAVIHMDPVETDNEQVLEMKQKVAALMKKIGEDVSIHDFRMVSGPTHTNLIFDIVVPFADKKSEAEVKEEVDRLVSTLGKQYFAVVDVDKAYVV
ncbi:MAG: cation diffusion facilitator family transporter [bacterium]|nr:cation diffusion facilitator family transporter [bacterium]